MSRGFRGKGTRLKPPDGLSGKEIGLWYAAHSKKSRSLEIDFSTLDLTGINLNKLSHLMTNIQAASAQKPNNNDSEDIPAPQLIDESDASNARPVSTTLTRRETLDQSLKQSLLATRNSPEYNRMLEFRKNLPAYAMSEEILSATRSNQILVISGETGCGKTTQIPQLILDDAILRENGSVTRILVTQPRRISAISVAERVASERAEKIGESVGYQIRLERRLPLRPQGSITYVTTGMLLQWLQSDPMLENFSHVIIDEVHERDFLSDFSLTILRNIARLKPDLRVILMSATINADEFCTYFDNCARLDLPGRLFPVQNYFLEDVLRMTNFWLPSSELSSLAANQQNYLARRFVDSGLTKGEARKASRMSNQSLNKWLKTQNGLSECAEQIIRIVDQDAYPQTDLIVHLVDHIINNSTSGAVLVFVPGASAIRETITALRQNNPTLYGERAGIVQIYPLHSRVSISKQRDLFANPPPGHRKVIVATNIAETSITIPDVVHVIDCGRIKVLDYDADSNTSSLSAVLISRSNAAQRRGRAGRIQSGFCYHLFTRYVYDHVMSEYPVPEMLRIRLEHIILQVKLLGLGPVSEFLASCISPPDPIAVERTLHFLHEIQALDLCKHSTRQNRLQQTRTNSRRQLRDAARVMKQTYNSTTGISEEEDQYTKESYHDLTGDRAELSALGVHLAQLPLDPQLAKLMIFGALFGCLEPALIVAACLNYRDPFEMPLDKQLPVMNLRRQLAQNTFSDHWIYVNVLQQYRKLTNPTDRRLFCDRYLLRENVLRDILSLMRDYAFLLHERKYINSPDPLNAAANVHKDNFALFRAILCGSLFPNILKLVPKQKNGFIQRPRVVARPLEGKVNISNFSVNENVRPINPVWAVYFQKTKTDGSSAFVMDTTIVPLRPVLLFSGILQQTSHDPCIFTVDSWIKVRSDQSLFDIIKSLRESLDSLLDSKFRNPSSTTWDCSKSEGLLLQTIVDLLTCESIPLAGIESTKSRTNFAECSGYENDDQFA